MEQALSIINHVVSQKSQLPILNHVLVKATKNSINLSATDLEIGIEFSLGAKVEREGELAIPAKILHELVASLPHEKITLSSQEQSLLVEAPKIKATVLGINSSEFPKIFEGEKELLFEIEVQELKKAIGRVYFASSTDEGRPVLTGVLLKVDENIQMIATDGYRLSMQLVRKTGKKKQGISLLVPARVLKQLLLFLSEKEGLVAFYKSKTNNQIIVATNDNIIVGRLLDGDFPPYEKIIPKSLETTAILDAEEFLKAVKTCAVFARESANIVRMKLEKDGIYFSANSPQVGENVVKLDVGVEGEENEIAFNIRFLLDLLSNMEATEVVFEMTGPLNPGTFKIRNDDSFLHIIMPVRIQTETE